MKLLIVTNFPKTKRCPKIFYYLVIGKKQIGSYNCIYDCSLLILLLLDDEVMEGWLAALTLKFYGVTIQINWSLWEHFWIVPFTSSDFRKRNLECLNFPLTNIRPSERVEPHQPTRPSTSCLSNKFKLYCGNVDWRVVIEMPSLRFCSRL